MAKSRWIERSLAFLRKTAPYYLLCLLFMLLVSMLASSLSPGLARSVLDGLQYLFYGLGILAALAYAVLRTWATWLFDPRISRGSRLVMGVVLLGCLGLGLAGELAGAVLLFIAVSVMAWVNGLSRLNAEARENGEYAAWEEAEREFWRDYGRESEDQGHFGGGGGYARPEYPSEVLPDPWEVLGLARGASRSEIRSAYRALCMACHPDVNGGVGDPARFRQATDAYHVLTGQESM